MDQPSAPFLDQAGSSVVGAPYSAVGTRETVTKLLDGNRIVEEQVTRFYRDGQGRTRMEHEPRGRGRVTGIIPFTMVSVNDWVSGENYFLDQQNKRAQVHPRFPEGMERPPSVTPPVPAPSPEVQLALGNASIGIGMGWPNMQTSSPTSLGEKIIRGVKSVGTRITYTMPADTVGNERPIAVTVDQWFSPQLGVVIESTSRSRTGHESTYRLEDIKLGEPDATLFQIPADYTKEEIGGRGFSLMRMEPATETKPEQNTVESTGTFILKPQQ